jgi:hypothetical protein
MVNVNKHEIFPTVVYQFNCGFNDLNALDVTQMDTYILANENVDMVNQSKDGLQNLSTFRKLVDIVHEQNEKYLNDLKYKFDKIEITSMWSNHLKPNHIHHIHIPTTYSLEYFIFILNFQHHQFNSLILEFNQVSLLQEKNQTSITQIWFSSIVCPALDIFFQHGCNIGFLQLL